LERKGGIQECGMGYATHGTTTVRYHEETWRYCCLFLLI